MVVWRYWTTSVCADVVAKVRWTSGVARCPVAYQGTTKAKMANVGVARAMGYSGLGFTRSTRTSRSSRCIWSSRALQGLSGNSGEFWYAKGALVWMELSVRKVVRGEFRLPRRRLANVGAQGPMGYSGLGSQGSTRTSKVFKVHLGGPKGCKAYLGNSGSSVPKDASWVDGLKVRKVFVG
jgi:hypothetical protein